MLKLLIGLALLFVIGTECQKFDRSDYSCFKDKSKENKFLLFGLSTVNCPPYHVCNDYCTGLCAPCTLPKCWGKYTCNNQNNSSMMVIGSMEVPCPEYTTCELPSSNDCIPCIRNKCTTTKGFECSIDDPTKVIFPGGLIQFCLNGVCNTGWEEPCSPCIKAQNLRAMSSMALLIQSLTAE